MRAPLLLLALLSSGCLSNGGPIPSGPPALTVQLSHWYGTPLGGPREVPEGSVLPERGTQTPAPGATPADAAPEAPGPPAGILPVVGPGEDDAAEDGSAHEEATRDEPTPDASVEDGRASEPTTQQEPAPDEPARVETEATGVADDPGQGAAPPAQEAERSEPEATESIGAGDDPEVDASGEAPPPDPTAEPMGAATGEPADGEGAGQRDAADAPTAGDARSGAAGEAGSGAARPVPDARGPADGPSPTAEGGDGATRPEDEPPRGDAPADAVGPWSVEAQVLWIDAPHARVLTDLDLAPLAPEATLVTSIGGGVPLLVSAPLLERSRVLALDSADELDLRLVDAGAARTELARLTGLLIDGFSLAVELRAPDDDPARPELAIELGRAGARTTLALAALGGPELPAPPESSSPEARARYLEDLARLDVEQRALLSGSPDLRRPHAAVLFPSPFDRGRTTLAVRLTLRPADDSELERLGTAVVDQAVRANARPEPAADAGRRAELAQSLALLGGDRSRQALGLLAQETGAALAGDAALVGDDERVAELARRVTTRVATLPRESESAAATIAWALERSSFELLLEGALDRSLDPALESLLLRHAGELGRLPSLLGDVLGAVDSVATLRARLIAENRLLLEDPDPSARRRAHRWLTARDAAPAGYDPLAPADERRAALSGSRADAAAVAGEARR